MGITRHIGLCFVIMALACAVSREAPDVASRTRVAALLQKEGGRLSGVEKERISKLVVELADRYQIDPLLILAVIKVESHFDTQAHSNRGALGLMQVKPIVVREVALSLNIDPRSHRRLKESVEFNLRVGVHYLASMLHRFGGNWSRALLAYNVGPTAALKHIHSGTKLDDHYSRKVLSAYVQFLTL